MALAALAAKAARAEPQLAAQTGLRCARCHTSPTGGGKRTPYGALFGQTELTLWDAAPRLGSPGEPNGWRGTALATLATGEVTEWLAVGGDVRVVSTTTFLEERKNSFDATQATVYLELRPWPGRVTLYADEEVGAGGARNREVWALVRGPWSTYLRAGRFLPPFGLRILDDAAYTRRVTGATFSSPDLGLEVGLDAGRLFAAAAWTNGAAGGSDTDVWKAFHGLVELSLSPLRLGLSASHNPTAAGCRTMAAAFAGLRWGRLVLLGEVDLITERSADRAGRRYQLAGLLEADVLLTKGLSLRAAWDATDGDLELSHDRRQRLRVGLDLFALRGVEAKLHFVHKQSETPDPLDRAHILEVGLHGYL
jgi:hypothetical protein